KRSRGVARRVAARPFGVTLPGLGGLSVSLWRLLGVDLATPCVSALLAKARLYAATGDGIVRLDEAAGHRWIGELFLAGSGAQCLAVDPLDPDTLYAGLRANGVRRTRDGGRNWVDCAL